MAIRTIRWPAESAPTEGEVRGILDREGLLPYSWSNGPGDVYGAHAHDYEKVIYVLEGSITFKLPDSGEEIMLEPGDRLELEQGVVHAAVVGPSGVVCLEAHR